ncbi:phage baseplate assembly protein V [Algimonas porphyrae]|uniref:Phage baseplate protein n=1 Tax=Algimonas porphyrae TaxID=1128113 RepID=A0ABQ5V1F3_9PROT|nr:phage baseplate assembly protein V [Algimonas porphyrae]GLQ20504.1 phage baseplate protein [Algimonas porphyrae]
MTNDKAFADLLERVDNLFRIGSVTHLDLAASPPVARIDDGDRISGWIPIMTRRAVGGEAEWDAPEIGERVLVIALGGRREQSRILPAALFCADHPAPSQDGNVVLRQHDDGASDGYDRQTHIRTIRVPDGGSLKIEVGSTRLNVHDGHIQIIADALTIDGTTVMIDADTIELGGSGGAKVARVGDAVNPNTFKIQEGSDVTKSN